jgi:MoxR-like ATPase
VAELSREELKARVDEVSKMVSAIREEVGKVIVGQRYMIDRLLIGLMARGHILLEGVPGLAKTTAVKTVARALRMEFSRIQFTPDLLPADVAGTQIYNLKTSTFSTHQGPLFANLVLADEINRAPPKTQAATLEAMQERQVTIGDLTYKLPEPFPRPRPTASCSSSRWATPPSSRSGRLCAGPSCRRRPSWTRSAPPAT